VRLYVAGDSPNSVNAARNLRALLAQHPSLEANLEIVDVLKAPEVALRDGVLVTPMLVKLAPLPERRVCGSLKDTEALMAALGLTGADGD
jgi:circadian clock protein KaiB